MHTRRIVETVAEGPVFLGIGPIRNRPRIVISADAEKRLRGRFDSRFTNSLLAANEESSCGSHDLRRDGLQIVFPHEPKWDAITEFRVQAGEPGLDHSRIFSFGEHPDHLEGKPQTLLGITIKLASVHPPIDGAHVPDAANVGGELAADEADELLDNLRDGDAKRFTMRRKIGTRCWNGCHSNLLQI